MKNIVILAAGPPKPDRERHTEINEINGRIIIDDIIEKCTIENTKLYIVINSKVEKLINHVKTHHKNIEILHPEDEKMYSTLNKALSIDGDTVLVSGDLINLQYGDINRFVDTQYNAALCRYLIPWPPGDIICEDFIRRCDIDDSVIYLSEKYKKTYLENVDDKVTKYMSKFYPNQKIDMNKSNDVLTYLSYDFFFKIWSDHKVNEFEDIGTLYFEHPIYLDND